METQKLNLKDAEDVAQTKGYTCKRDAYAGVYIKDANNKTITYLSERKYGLAWQVSDGTKFITERITSLDQLKQKFDAPAPIVITKPIIETIEIVAEPLDAKSQELVPKDFTYIERKVDTGCTDLQEFEEAVSEGKNVLLEGPTGSGKTTLVRKYCAKHKLPYKRVSLNGGATVEDLVGHYVLRNMETSWIDGILTQAVRNGWVLVIDEINAAPSEVLFVLNSLLDDERILILSSKDGEVVKPHKNFRVIATCNPTEQGYAGTNEINEALRDRFHLTFYIDYDTTVEKKVMKSMKLDGDKIEDILNLVKKLRESYAQSEIITPFSTRSVINFAELVNKGKERLILNRFRASERAVISDLLDVFIYKKKAPADPTDSTDI